VEQYDFLSERKHTQRNVWMINPRCPLKRHELRRQGHVRLGHDGQWRSEETLSFHALRYNKIVGCYHREYPMGWAALSTQRSGASLTQLFGRNAETKWVSKGLGQYAALATGRDDKPVRIALKVSQTLDKHSVISALATAHAYFQDPTQTRSPSLFEPYWRATLIPNLTSP
jgi:hypothetical protein